VLGLSIDRTGIEVVQKYLEELDLTFPTLHDPTGKTAAEYGVRGIPATFFIDKDGTVLGGVVGPREWDGEAVQQLVEQFLAESKEE
jgi:peroxiredoxin